MTDMIGLIKMELLVVKIARLMLMEIHPKWREGRAKLKYKDKIVSVLFDNQNSYISSFSNYLCHWTFQYKENKGSSRSHEKYGTLCDPCQFRAFKLHVEKGWCCVDGDMGENGIICWIRQVRSILKV